MERTITKSSPKLNSLIARYKELSLEVADKQTQIEKLEEERNKIAMHGQKIKDRMAPIVDSLIAGELGEFETIVNAQRVKDSEEMVEIQVVDRVEQFKDAWRKKALEPKVTPKEE